MPSLCTVNRSVASVSTKNSYDFHCRRYQACTGCGVLNSPQWSEAIVHRCNGSFKWQRATMFRQVVAVRSRISRTMFPHSSEFLMQQCFQRALTFFASSLRPIRGRENFMSDDAPDDVSVAMMTA